MQVVLSERVKFRLDTIGADDRKRITAWFDYLQNWEEDPFAKSRSVLLDIPGKSVYMFRTTTDLRIFYTVDLPNKTITVIDFATMDTIALFRDAS